MKPSIRCCALAQTSSAHRCAPAGALVLRVDDRGVKGNFDSKLQTSGLLPASQTGLRDSCLPSGI